MSPSLRIRPRHPLVLARDRRQNHHIQYTIIPGPLKRITFYILDETCNYEILEKKSEELKLFN